MPQPPGAVCVRHGRIVCGSRSHRHAAGARERAHGAPGADTPLMSAAPGGPLRVAIVGAGTMGRWHAAAAAAAGGVLTAVADPAPERAAALGAPSCFDSLGDLVESGLPLDVVHVCTPLASHESLVREALEAGLHVIVEKPLGADAESTAGLLLAAAGRGVTLVPVHQFLFQQGVQRLLRRKERLGTVVRCAFDAATAGAQVPGVDPDELVADILPHPLSLFSRIARDGAHEVDRLAWTCLRPGSGELRALASAGGASFEIVITTRGRPTRAELELIGTRGSARADLFHGFAVLEGGGATRVRKLVRPFVQSGATLAVAGANLAGRALRREPAYPGLRELVRRTYEAIGSGGPPPIGPRETLAVARARDAILAAC